jgi:hypothetical protein
MALLLEDQLVSPEVNVERVHISYAELLLAHQPMN